ncbi:RNA polymerase sigma-H factor [Halobacteroides halobius DSM 5150]|uniref:RNA polymerase sigma-H factor n=1 Tax=Halobacteroides halobius (strain ATCC 35273 / DSM 5150 / MD-1) TaxID=748449 RepID=L0K6M5_HALHC|nr:RNA polymerase sporulation sigma factor SigH [Halobacteroides halobius]AGB40185.1 RNA polymerase sigma-H factor [Halobacteroides halobius DSM 5150]
MAKPISQQEVYANYNNMSDDELVELAQQGNNLAIEYLIKKYKNFVKAKAKSYFLIGADRQDIIQEGLIGLYKAIRDYEVDRLASFRSFAELCITRQIITAIKTATRQKHQPLNSYVSLDKPIFSKESDRTLLDVLEGHKIHDPEKIFVTNQAYDYLEKNIKEMLSDLEFAVLKEYLRDKSYDEIADTLNRHVKSVDNALQRIKNKINDFLEENDF